MDVPVAANVLGTLGAVCWSVQLVPQIVINYRRHDATGLQPSMMMLWACAGVPLGVYNIVEDFNIALRIQPQILTALSLVTWIQCHYYQRNWPITRCLLIVTPIALAMGGIQAALVLVLRAFAPRRGASDWPRALMAVLAAVLLAAGVLRHYWDIWTHRTVRGISFVFVAIDAAGDVFSLASVFFQPRLDVLGMAVYGSELALWLGVFACGGYYNLLPWMRARWGRASAGGSGDDGSAAGRSGRPGDGEMAAPVVALHDMSSSTSVFRTASGESDGLRSRTVASTQKGSGEGCGPVP